MKIADAMQGLMWCDFAKAVRAKDRARFNEKGLRHLQAVARRERRRMLQILSSAHTGVDADALHAIARGWSEADFALSRKEQNLSAILHAARHARDSGEGPQLRANAQQMLAYLRGVLSEPVLVAAYRSQGVFRRVPLDWTVAQLLTHLQEEHSAVRTRIAQRIASDPACSFVTAPYSAPAQTGTVFGSAPRESSVDPERHASPGAVDRRKDHVSAGSTAAEEPSRSSARESAPAVQPAH